MEKRLILYAEDDADDRFIFEDAFSSYKDEVEIVLFPDGLELIKYLTKENQVQPSLIVLDINMHQLDGKDTLRILRDLSRYSATPVVLLTTSNWPMDSYFAKLFNAGFITKCIDQIQMQRVAEELLSYCGIKPQIEKLEFILTAKGR